MSYSCSDVVSELAVQLRDAGYVIYNGNAQTGETVKDESGDDWWFTWTQPGCDIETGEACNSELGATTDAMCHFFREAKIGKEKAV